MKMQIALREVGETRAEHAVHVAVGVLEAPADEVAGFEERMVNFRFSVDPAHGFVQGGVCLFNPHVITEGYGKEDDERLLEMSDLENLTTCSLRRTLPDRAQNAEFAFRRTDVEPSEPGHLVMAFAGMVYTPVGTKLDARHLYQLDDAVGLPGLIGHRLMLANGIVGTTCRPELGEIDVSEATRGDALPSFLRQPWWGFGEEPMSLPGTMRVGTYAELERFHELHFANRSEAENAEYEPLKDKMRGLGFGMLLKDPAYEAFVRGMRESGSPSRFKPIALSQMESREEVAATLVKATLKM